ncbi:hypothetical protein ACX3O0_06315 [Homoserinimonas sp. A447]
MAGSHETSPGSDRDSGTGRDNESATGTPRWVIVSGIIVLVLIVAFAALHFAGGGFVGHL